MKNIVVLVFMSLFTLTSCGPSAEERAMEQKRHDDIIRSNAIIETQNKYENKQVLTSRIEGMNNRQKVLKNKMEQNIADLDVAIDKMKRIKEYQIGRLHSKRDEQIRSQSIYIQKLEENIKSLRANVSETEQKLSQLKFQLSQIQ